MARKTAAPASAWRDLLREIGYLHKTRGASGAVGVLPGTLAEGIGRLAAEALEEA